MIREQAGGDVEGRTSEFVTTRLVVPILGPRGLLTYGGRSVCLSSRDASVVSVLVRNFGSEVPDVELFERVWPHGTTRRALRARLRRLDRRLARVGLRIVDSGYRSRTLRPAAGP